MRLICTLVMIFLLPVGCTPGFEGEYEDPAKQEIIDDKWNETDSHKTAERMIKGMITDEWLKEFRKLEGRRPVIVLSDVENRTEEHLDVKTLTEFIRDEMINSKQVRFVSAKLRSKILSELDYQNSAAVNKKTAKKRGRHVGADFILSGSVSSQVHSQGEIRTVSYFTNLTLTSVETAIIDWSDKYEIKKKFRRSGSSW
jgi:penicillin-binding protein activator